MRALSFLLVLAAACGGAEPPPASPAPQGSPAAPAAVPAAADAEGSVEGTRRVEVDIRGEGYTPTSVEARPGEPVVLVFHRADGANCGGEVVFPDTGERYEIPVGQRVEVPVTAPASGELAFTCGMGMYKGAIVVGA